MDVAGFEFRLLWITSDGRTLDKNIEFFEEKTSLNFKNASELSSRKSKGISSTLERNFLIRYTPVGKVLGVDVTNLTTFKAKDTYLFSLKLKEDYNRLIDLHNISQLCVSNIIISDNKAKNISAKIKDSCFRFNVSDNHNSLSACHNFDCTQCRYLSNSLHHSVISNNVRLCELCCS